MNTTDELLSMADKWREEGRAIRVQLIGERDVLAKRVAEIDKRLAALGLDQDEAPAPPAQLPAAPSLSQRNGHAVQRVRPGASVTELVAAILQAATRPMGASEVIAIARGSRPSVKTTDIHTALYRFRKSRKVKIAGDKGAWTYTWEGPQS